MSYEQQVFLTQTHAAFCYVVLIDGDPMGAFTECTLPVIEWEIEEVKEGGVNNYVHQLPGRRKSGRLTLKNGIGKSTVFDWFLTIVEADVHKKTLRRKVSVKLKNTLLQDICTWTFEDAVPVKWTGPQLRSDANAIAIQTIEFACGALTVTMP